MSSRETGSSLASESVPGPRNRTLAIFLVSVAGLFLELMLIRWIGTEVRIFAYLQNTVLIVCFLGLGLGCFTCRQEISLRRLLVPLFCLTMILGLSFTRAIIARITDLLSVLSDLLIWEHAISDGIGQSVLRVVLGLGLTFGLMVLLWEIFVPLGRLLGRLMDDHPRIIWAYSVNIAGSLLGIWLFVAMSAFSLPPVAWLLTAAVLLVWFFGRGRELRLNLALMGAIVLAAWVAGVDHSALQVAWSPYQKLVLSENDEGKGIWSGKYLITVNNAGYQGIIDLSEEGLKSNARIPAEMYGLSQYDIPLLLHPNPERVLCVGAGSGNDVAGALRGGARHVTAVEIDPAIIEMGRRYHPERPYDSSRVTIVNDDARSFFATTREKFDVIIFGLLDSHTTTAMTNARLDHYVYTRESMQRARSLLKDGGVMALSFEALKPFISDRMARCIHEVFGEVPLAFRVPHNYTGWGGAMFITGDKSNIDAGLAANPRLAAQITAWQGAEPLELTYTTRVTTDDWPYIYLQKARVPSLYFLLGALMVGLLGYSKYRLKMPQLVGRWERTHWHFFCLGAAFLLLEVQNISKASVVLGNTWLVNAVIISGILLMILLANLIAYKFPRLRSGTVGCWLVGSCVALYFVDLSRFGFLPFVMKAVIVGALTTLPLMFSGIIFIRSFARVPRKDAALGANLIGSIVGGLLQSVTFVTGIKALLLIVAGLYLAALIFTPRCVVEQGSLDDEDEEFEQAPAESEEPELVGA